MKLQYQTYWTSRDDDESNINWIREFYRSVYSNYKNEEPVPDSTVDGCHVNYPDVDLVD